MSKKRTKILKVRFSRDGIFAMVIFIIALAVLLGAFGIAFMSHGNGDWHIALLGVISFLTFAAGLSLAVHDIISRPREDGKPWISKIAAGVNGGGMVLILALYIFGSLY